MFKLSQRSKLEQLQNREKFWWPASQVLEKLIQVVLKSGILFDRVSAQIVEGFLRQRNGDQQWSVMVHPGRTTVHSPWVIVRRVNVPTNSGVLRVPLISRRHNAIARSLHYKGRLLMPGWTLFMEETKRIARVDLMGIRRAL